MEEADLEDYVSRGLGMASGRDSKVSLFYKNGGGVGDVYASLFSCVSHGITPHTGRWPLASIASS